MLEGISSLRINGDGTVTDIDTDLMWQQETSMPMTWQEAVEYCEKLFLGYQGDWRLPSRDELSSLVDHIRYAPAIDPIAFPDTISSDYWSFSECADDPTDRAWGVDFGNGCVNGAAKWCRCYMRAVRSGQSGLEMEDESNVPDIPNIPSPPTRRSITEGKSRKNDTIDKQKEKIEINIIINVSLWQAIKLRIAGKYIKEHIEMMLKENLDGKSINDAPKYLFHVDE